KYLLDIAMQFDLKVMVGLPWEQHITFLDNPATGKDIVRRVKEGVSSCEKHPAILCYTIGNEIPASIVRWYGKKKIERFLKQLYKAVKSVDPQRLVTYVNYPTTEYLNLHFLDFDCFNIYLETPEKLRSYIARLHNLSGDRPLVLAEIGLDSLRNGVDKQADVLRWQMETIYGNGCAGMFVFAWTDQWWRGGFEIDDWDFGLVDRQRQPKKALYKVSDALRSVPISQAIDLPFISVVVCSYNGSATIKDTMEGLLHLEYPRFEVIVVNDGSTDHLVQIVKNYPVQLITTENQGLSNARNTGLNAAKGEVIAYIDDDAYPDPHWLLYLAYAYRTSNHNGIGGPNMLPYEDGFIASCVANAPGGPVHVLETDEIAEHVPGCNMSFRKQALVDIGGFDPNYRIAGDDVDVCWRIQKNGGTIGFHHSALVWHHRRNSLKAYWKQQKGYGKAEALLELKWPEKYNIFGHLTWAGRIYGNGITLPVHFKKEKVYHGTWGSALFQSVYKPSNSIINVLPLMPEWYFIVALLMFISMLGILWAPLLWTIPITFTSLVVIIVQAIVSTYKRTSLAPDKRRLRAYILIMVLHFVQPAARLYGRIKHGLTPWRKRKQRTPLRFLFTFLPKTFTYWSESWQSLEHWLLEVEQNLIRAKVRVKRGGNFDRWDLQLHMGVVAINRAIMLIEEHGANRQFIRLKAWCLPSTMNIIFFISMTALGIASGIAGAWIVCSFFTVVSVLILVEYCTDTAILLYKLYTAFQQAQHIVPLRIIQQAISADKTDSIPIEGMFIHLEDSSKDNRT
ncbi:MAG TPA: glycosyltransferase, partial [Flavisolibacter sp.]|nr:glycosyltransferase [Flavisolibacter sp.]